MNNIKYLVSLIVFFTLFSCKNTNEGKNEEKNEVKATKACPYEALMSETVSSSSTNGSQMSIDLEGKIMTNVKKLLDVEGTLKLNDSIFLNIEKTLKNRNVIYPSDFLVIHNSLTQILCAIEMDLSNTTDADLKARLIEDKIKKRTEYFDFLLRKTTISNPKNESLVSVKSNNRVTTQHSNSEKNNMKIEVKDNGKIGNILNLKGDSNKIYIKQDF